jgi:heat shock protein HslJ
VRPVFLLGLLAACGSTAGERWERIQGAEWSLSRIESTPALDGAQVSLTFGVGRLYGEAVNRYGGPYVRTEDTLKIESIGATRKFLDKPPGAMEQEARYLKLLEQADGFKVRGDYLDLSSGGRTILEFKRKLPTPPS